MVFRRFLRLGGVAAACALVVVGGLAGSGRAANGNVTLHISSDSPGVASITVPFDSFGTGANPNVACTGTGASQPAKTVTQGGTATVAVQTFSSVKLGSVGSSTSGYSFDRWTSGTASADSGTTVTGSPTPCLSGSTSGVNGNVTDLYAHFTHVNQAPTTPGTPSGTSPNNGAFTLTWTASSDPDSDPITYTLQHERSDQSSYTDVGTSTTSSYEFTSGSKEGGGRWTYRVKACDASLCSSFSTISSTIVVDRSAPNPPTVGTNRAPDYTGNGNWWADSVTITWTSAGDLLLADGTAGSGVTSVTAAKTITTQGAFSEDGTATDAVGNVSSATTKSGNVDTENPVLTPTATSNSSTYTSGSWTNHDVLVHFGCTDTGGSGVASTTADATVSTEGTGQSAPGTCTDNVGKTANASFTDIRIDKTNPVVGAHADVTAEATASSGASVTFTAPSGADNLGGSGLAGSVACAPASASTFALGTTTVTCTVFDQAGNSGSSQFHVTVQDTTAPTIAAHADVTAEATSSSGAAVNYTPPNAQDAVDGTFAATCTPAPNTTFALGETTVTCNAVDNAGNHATATTFKVTVSDTTAPTIAAHADVTAEATSSSGAIVNYTPPNAQDAVDGTFAATCSPAPGATFPLGNTTVTCNATDAHSNAATPTTFKVTVSDTTAPTIAAHADVTAEATSPSGAIVNYTPSDAQDAVDGTFAATCSPAPGATFPLGDTTVTCNAVDNAGNHATATTFKVTVSDTTPPTLTVPSSNVTAEASGPTGAAVSYTVSATDALDPSPTVTCKVGTTTVNSGDTFPIGDTTVTCTASDASANTSAPKSFHIVVGDTIAPGSTITFAANNGLYSAGAFAAGCGTVAGDLCGTASDNASGVAQVEVRIQRTSDARYWNGSIWVVAATWNVASGTTAWSYNFAAGSDTYALSARATDVSGNVQAPPAGASFTVDATAPTSAVSFPADGASYTPAAYDAGCGGATGDLCGTASDLGASVAKVEVSVRRGDGLYWNGTAWVAAQMWTQTNGTTSWSLPLDPGPGSYTVSTRATDGVGNVETPGATTSFVIDATAPAVDAHANLQAEATAASGAPVSFTAPAATDAVDGARSVDCAPSSGSTFPLGVSTVVCSASDRAGNTGSSSFDVTVVDTTPPTVVSQAVVSVEATGPGGAAVSFTGPSATDLVDGTIASSCLPASGSTFALGATTVTCTATDAHTNAGSGTFTVTVSDTTPPTIATAPNVSAEESGADGAVVHYAVPGATDTVDGATTPTCTPPPGSLFPPGTTTVTCTSTDAHGNTSTLSFFITVLAQGALPPPVPGQSFNALPTSGTVLIKLPGTDTFVPLTEGMQLPVGTTIDATGGTLELVSADGDGFFYGGKFLVLEPLTSTSSMRALSGFAAVAGPRTTNLNLIGGNFGICSKPKAPKRKTYSVEAADKKPKPPATKPSKKPVRHLWGNGKGHFRTKGKYSAATVRGTWWEVVDRCDGTLTRVNRGVVTVSDFARNRNVSVKAGQTYLAKKPATKPAKKPASKPAKKAKTKKRG